MSENIGVLVEWDDERGFGFIQHESGKKIFVHISAVRAQRRPVVGDKVGFNVQQDETGRLSAGYMRMQDVLVNGEGAKWTKAKPSKKKQGKASKKQFIFSSYFAMAVVFLVLLGSWKVFIQYGFAWTIAIYLVVSLIGVFMYRADKMAAQSNQSRISERSLHVMELLGGWPGAAVAQVLFRHKNQKISYQHVFMAILFIHGALWLDYLLGWAIAKNLVLPIFYQTKQLVVMVIEMVLGGLADWLG